MVGEAPHPFQIARVEAGAMRWEPEPLGAQAVQDNAQAGF